MDLQQADAITGQGAAAPDVKEAPEAETSAPSTEAVQEAPAQPPAESKPAQKAPEENKIPYDRFKEKVDEVNLLKNSLRDLEQKLEERLPPKPQQEDPLIAQAVKSMIDNGADETVAKALAETVVNLTKSQVKPIETGLETDRWLADFSKKHPDFDENKVGEIFSALPKRSQLAVASAPEMLEFLYSHAKVQNFEAELEKARKEGANSAYESKQLKAGVSSAPTAAAIPENYDASNIGKKVGDMSLGEYAKEREKILSSLYGKNYNPRP